MKSLLLFLTLITFRTFAQTDLKFDKRFVECEDQWVAFQKDKEDSYTYGFIYIDAEAGLTFNMEGNFKVVDNSITAEKIKENVKIRLEPNNVKVAVIPGTMYKDLQIEPVPEWLHYYQTDLNSIQRLYEWGFMYNGWDNCPKALTYLEKAREIDRNYEGLTVELAYSYNCMKQFDKAEKVLEEELVLHPADAYVNKEYIYTVSKTTAIEKAVDQYHKYTAAKNDATYNAENCFNIMQYYYKERDNENFNTWYKELKKCQNDNKMITEYADKMKAEMKK